MLKTRQIAPNATLQHTATHCNTLQHTATHCNTLQQNAPHCNTLHHTAPCRIAPGSGTQEKGVFFKVVLNDITRKPPCPAKRTCLYNKENPLSRDPESGAILHGAVCCSVLQSPGAFQDVLFVLTHAQTLLDSVAHCNTLQHNAPHCNPLHYTATWRIAPRVWNAGKVFVLKEERKNLVKDYTFSHAHTEAHTHKHTCTISTQEEWRQPGTGAWLREAEERLS